MQTIRILGRMSCSTEVRWKKHSALPRFCQFTKALAKSPRNIITREMARA